MRGEHTPKKYQSIETLVYRLQSLQVICPLICCTKLLFKEFNVSVSPWSDITSPIMLCALIALYVRINCTLPSHLNGLLFPASYSLCHGGARFKTIAIIRKKAVRHLIVIISQCKFSIVSAVRKKGVFQYLFD